MNQISKHAKVLIIGGGPAGYTAGIYTARANLNPIQFLGYQPGGQLTITTEVENFPGFSQAVQGPWLMQEMRLQAEHVGCVTIEEEIVKADLLNTPFTLTSDSGTTYTCDSLIIATGAAAKWLGIESEEYFRGFGVSGCATCDGFFFKGKKVVVVGGGNAAVEEALYLTHHAKEVVLIHRRDSLRAEKIIQERLLKHPQISVIWDSVIEEVLGDKEPRNVTGVRLKNVKDNSESRLDCDGVFVAIGHQPMSNLFAGQLELDSNGYIKTEPGSTKTSISGVFAAGDVQDTKFRQAITAAGQGCMAAIEAERFLAK